MQSGPICIRGIMGISLLQSCSQDNRCRVQDQGLLGQSQELQVLVKNEGDRQEKWMQLEMCCGRHMMGYRAANVNYRSILDQLNHFWTSLLNQWFGFEGGVIYYFFETWYHMSRDPVQAPTPRLVLLLTIIHQMVRVSVDLCIGLDVYFSYGVCQTRQDYFKRGSEPPSVCCRYEALLSKPATGFQPNKLSNKRQAHFWACVILLSCPGIWAVSCKVCI